jgi:hypothetical protein
MSTVAFRPLTDVETAFKAVVWDPLIKVGEVALAGAQASIPVLDLPIFDDLEDDAIQAITDWAFTQLVQLIDIEAIQLVGAERQAAWSKASEALAVISQEQGVNSDAYKQELATQVTAFAAFVRTGS